jgi:hypothetical protein
LLIDINAPLVVAVAIRIMTARHRRVADKSYEPIASVKPDSETCPLHSFSDVRIAQLLHRPVAPAASQRARRGRK